MYKYLQYRDHKNGGYRKYIYMRIILKLEEDIEGYVYLLERKKDAVDFLSFR